MSAPIERLHPVPSQYLLDRKGIDGAKARPSLVLLYDLKLSIVTYIAAHEHADSTTLSIYKELTRLGDDDVLQKLFPLDDPVDEE